MMQRSRSYPVTRLKVVLLLSSVASLVMLVMAAVKENFTAEWRIHQQEYARGLSETSYGTATRSRDYPLEIRQAYLEEWGRVDRCVTCHVGIDDPAAEDRPQPLTKHPGDLLQHHPSDKFGCTVCHRGQGRATEKDAAHGRVPFWDEPLLAGDLVQASCTQCHHGDEVPLAPVLNRGRHLLVELGCVGCHKAGGLEVADKVGPQLESVGSKVTPSWLRRWLANPSDYWPKHKMPDYYLAPGAIDALAAYLMTAHNPQIDNMDEWEGDYDAGANLCREGGQCIVCHVTRLDYADNPVGGQIGPSLLKTGNKINQQWLVAFFQDPHSFLPHTKMPGYYFSRKEALDLAQFVTEEWTDYDLLDAEEQEPELPEPTQEQIRQGERLYAELGCAGCHELGETKATYDATDLTFIGSTPAHQLSFGDAKVRRSVPDFLYTKLKSPKLLHPPFELPAREDPAAAIWENLKPAALFSVSYPMVAGPENERLAWILKQVKRAGVLGDQPQLPTGSTDQQAKWLVEALNEAGALNPLKMPDFQLSDEDAEALTIALMSLSEVGAPSKRFEAPQRQKILFNPKDEFGRLERHYRCLSCHKIRESGELLASDLTYEGNRVNRDWLHHFLNKPYSMRRIITIAMPIFHFPVEESRIMADYMANVFVDSEMGAAWKLNRAKADAERGKALFDAKGCIACHQLHGTGGDVGPSLTTQVPEFPQGTWAGDKLKGEWVYAWLKNPQAMLPETIEPNLG
ncbi:MAG: c-type cytochrome, partial [Pirellulaceae bacterium]